MRSMFEKRQCGSAHFVVRHRGYEIVPKRDDYRDDISLVPAEPGWPVRSEYRQRRAHDGP
jgi:hypothetical protein